MTCDSCWVPKLTKGKPGTYQLGQQILPTDVYTHFKKKKKERKKNGSAADLRVKGGGYNPTNHKKRLRARGVFFLFLSPRKKGEGYYVPYVLYPIRVFPFYITE
jgi:hypothetical protein